MDELVKKQIIDLCQRAAEQAKAEDAKFGPDLVRLEADPVELTDPKYYRQN